MRQELAESFRLRGGKGEDTGYFVVAIRFEVSNRGCLRRFRVCKSVQLIRNQGGTMKIIGGEVRAEIRAVAEDGAVLHEAVFEKDFLAGGDVGACEKKLAVSAHNA